MKERSLSCWVERLTNSGTRHNGIRAPYSAQHCLFSRRRRMYAQHSPRQQARIQEVRRDASTLLQWHLQCSSRKASKCDLPVVALVVACPLCCDSGSMTAKMTTWLHCWFSVSQEHAHVESRTRNWGLGVRHNVWLQDTGMINRALKETII